MHGGVGVRGVQGDGRVREEQYFYFLTQGDWDDGHHSDHEEDSHSFPALDVGQLENYEDDMFDRHQGAAGEEEEWERGGGGGPVLGWVGGRNVSSFYAGNAAVLAGERVERENDCMRSDARSLDEGLFPATRRASLPHGAESQQQNHFALDAVPGISPAPSSSMGFHTFTEETTQAAESPSPWHAGISTGVLWSREEDSRPAGRPTSEASTVMGRQVPSERRGGREGGFSHPPVMTAGVPLTSSQSHQHTNPGQQVHISTTLGLVSPAERIRSRLVADRPWGRQDEVSSLAESEQGDWGVENRMVSDELSGSGGYQHSGQVTDRAHGYDSHWRGSHNHSGLDTSQHHHHYDRHDHSHHQQQHYQNQQQHHQLNHYHHQREDPLHIYHHHHSHHQHHLHQQHPQHSHHPHQPHQHQQQHNNDGLHRHTDGGAARQATAGGGWAVRAGRWGRRVEQRLRRRLQLAAAQSIPPESMVLLVACGVGLATGFSVVLFNDTVRRRGGGEGGGDGGHG